MLEFKIVRVVSGSLCILMVSLLGCMLHWFALGGSLASLVQVEKVLNSVTREVSRASMLSCCFSFVHEMCWWCCQSKLRVEEVVFPKSKNMNTLGVV